MLSTSTLACTFTKPTIKIRSNETPLSVEYQLSTIIKRSYSKDAMVLLGNFTPQINISYAAKQTFNQTNRCTSVNEIDIVINWIPKIVIAKEVSQNSCVLQETMSHEQKHYSFQKTAIEKTVRDFPEYFMSNIWDKYKASPEHLKEETLKTVAQYVNYVANPLHASIDNDIEYNRISQSCNGDTSKSVGQIITNSKYFNIYK